MLNQLIRYEPAIKIIHTNKKLNNILEIGSGQNGICKFLERQIVGLDIDFKDYGKKIKINPKIKPVKGDITTKTEFKKNEFDLTICIDVLEHIDKEKREFAINEMIRVSKKIYLALPIGKDSKKIDKLLYKYFRILVKNPPLWIIEHLNKDFLLEGEIENILKKRKDLKFKKFYNENIYFHFVLIILETIPLINKLLEKISKFYFAKELIPVMNFGKTYREVFIIEKI